VKPELALAVQRAADSLNYSVNPIGRALKQRATGTVGMVVPDIANPFFPAMVRAIEGALATEGLGLFLCDANDSARVEAARVEALLRRQVDGLIISPVHSELSRPAILAASRRVPVIQVDRVIDVPTDVVAVDQAKIITMIVEHLRSTGRARLAFVTSGESISPMAERLAAYQRAVGDAEGAHRVYARDLSVDWGTKAAAAMLADRDSLPDGVVCANDLIAIGVMRALRAAGIQIPRDVAVAGVDDTPLAQVTEPALTSVRQPVGQLGEEVVRMLLIRRRAPADSPRRLILSPELVVRGSTVVDWYDQGGNYQ
jgi:LacI family transcriptional regulator